MLYAMCFFLGTALGTGYGYLMVRRVTSHQRGATLAKGNIIHLVESGHISRENGEAMLRQMGYGDVRL